MKQHQTRINLITNIVALFVNILVGIYYTPYLVNNMGVEQYGILPLALIINQYISVLTGILTHSYTRFYSISIGKGNYFEASKNISTSLIVVLFLVSIICAFTVPFVFNVECFFSIPREYIDDARLLFTFTLASFCCSLFSSLLNVTLYALNRLDLMNLLNIARLFFKFGIVVFLFNCVGVNVSFVGLSGIITEIIVLFISLLLFFRYKPKEVKLHIQLFDKTTLRVIVIMSVWVLVQQCGDTLLYRTDNIIINNYFGLENSGTLGAISELCFYVRMAVGVIGGLFGPLIIIAYSEEKHERVQNLAYGQSFVVGSLTAIMAGLVSGFGQPLLKEWIGNGIENYSSWLTIKMMVVPFYAAGGILAFVYRAWNKVKMPAIWTVIIGVVDIVVVLMFLNSYHGSYAIEIMLLISTVFSISQCYILNNICVNDIYPHNKKRSLGVGLRICIIFSFSYFFGHVIAQTASIDSIVFVALFLVSSGVVVIATVYLICFKKEERELLWSIIK